MQAVIASYDFGSSDIIPRETEGYGFELVRLSVCLSVCPAWDRVLCARELGMKELS